MGDQLSGIAVFVQAVEAGSFALAAERLHLSRSAVGKVIARLEQRLDVRLFHRTTRRQSLTEDGHAFYERCVRALAELDAAEAGFASGRREPGGCLRVSVPVLFGRHCVAPILLGLARTHPQLRVEISFNDRVVDLLEDGYDLGVRIGTLPDSASLAGRLLGTQRMGICAAPSYLDAHGRPDTVDELGRHSAILYGRPGYEVRWRVREAGVIREPRLTSRVRMDDLEAIVDAAVAGLGLAWLPCWLIASRVHARQLEMVMHSDRVISSGIHAVWPQTRHLPAKTRVAIDALAAQIPALVGPPQRLDQAA